jgi:zinc-finger of transposase IS204/IS1001/IS1096/IS1165
MATSPGAESDRWCIVMVVVERDGSLVLVVEPTRAAVSCPDCGELSRRQHSRYERHPLDLPWRGQTVRMLVHNRRWFCDTPTCPRKIFAERFDGALARYARRTDGTTDLLTTFALQAGALSSCRPGRAWTCREARILLDGYLSATHSGLSDVLPGGMCLRANLSVGGGGQLVSTGAEVIGDSAERDQKTLRVLS